MKSCHEQKFLELDVLVESLSLEVPIYVVMEGYEPPFFTRFFLWDHSKANVSLLPWKLSIPISDQMPFFMGSLAMKHGHRPRHEHETYTDTSIPVIIEKMNKLKVITSVGVGNRH